MTCSYGALKLVAGEWTEWSLDEVEFNGNRHDIFEAAQSPSGQLWLSTYALGPITQGDGGPFKSVYEGPQGQRFIRDILEDAEQNIWFATDVGLYRAKQTAFRNFGKADGMEHTWVLSMAMDTEGGLWFANQVELYYQAKGSNTIEVAPSPGEVSPNVVYGLPSGGVVVGKLEGQVFTSIDAEWTYLGNTRARVLSFCEDSAGTLWIGTERGLWQWDGQSLDKVNPTEKTSNVWVDVIKLNSNGEVIVSLQGQGLWVLRENQWQRFTPDSIPAFQSIHDFKFDQERALWGINRFSQIVTFDGVEWRSFDYDLTEDYVELRGILPDSHGDVWLSSSNGVYHFNRNDFLAGEITDVTHTKRFFRKNGLGTATSSRTSSGLLEDTEGRVWVATQGGASVADPQRLSATHDRTIQGLPLIHAITVDHVEQSHHDLLPLRLSPETEHFKIDYTATYVGNPEDATFRYRLVGQDRNWLEVDHQRMVVYPRPKPGSYVVELQVADCHGQWSPQIATLPFEMLPFWWERVSVHLAGVALVIGMIAWSIYKRFRRLHILSRMQLSFSRQLARTAEEERRKIASEIHDGLGQDLLVLKGQIEIVGLKNGDLQDELEPIFTDVKDTIKLAREISYDLHPANLSRLGLAPSLVTLTERCARSTGVELCCDIQSPDKALSEDQQIHLYRITQEALSNALKYSNASVIRVSFKPSGTDWELLVSDDGEGASETAIGQGHGLQNMKERARLIEADFSWDSTLGQGTQVKVLIKNL